MNVGIIGAGNISSSVHLPLLSCMDEISINFIADRALAGRIVCSRCGSPYKKNNLIFKNTSSNKFIKILLIL